MKTEKQVRTWWIEFDPMCVGHYGDAWSTRQTSNDMKVIAHEDHLAIVAELEARITRLREAFQKMLDGFEVVEKKNYDIAIKEISRLKKLLKKV